MGPADQPIYFFFSVTNLDSRPRPRPIPSPASHLLFAPPAQAYTRCTAPSLPRVEKKGPRAQPCMPTQTCLPHVLPPDPADLQARTPCRTIPLIPAPSPLITQTCCVLPCAAQVYSSLSAAAPRNRPTDLRPHLPEAGKPCVPLALHALRLLLASRCLTSPIRSPPPPSPGCMTTNRIKPSPATGTASRQRKRHRSGSRNRSHHLSCRVGTSSPTEQNAAARRRPLSPFQEVPVRALHVPRSARAVAALPSALGEIPVPRAFRFAASGHFP